MTYVPCLGDQFRIRPSITSTFGPAVVGPIKQDRIWYFAAVGRWGPLCGNRAFYNPLQGQASKEVASMVRNAATPPRSSTPGSQASIPNAMRHDETSREFRLVSQSLFATVQATSNSA